jgi:hypothetical protein
VSILIGAIVSALSAGAASGATAQRRRQSPTPTMALNPSSADGLEPRAKQLLPSTSSSRSPIPRAEDRPLLRN